MKGIILHGGLGTRLRPLTHTGPKQLIPVANKPVSQYAVEDLKEAGIEDVAIIVGGTAPEKIAEYYEDGSRFGIKITYLKQDQPKGIAHAIGLCRDFIKDESFAVYLGDNILKGGIKKFVDEFANSQCDAMVLLCRVKEPQRFGVAEFKDGKLVRLVEKPKVPPSDCALIGIYLLKPVIFEAIEELTPSWRGELEITDSIQKLMDWGLKVDYKFVTGWWKDTGKPEDILEANQLILSELFPFNHGTIEEGVTINGKVGIDSGTLIRRGCNIRGPAIIGKGCDIGPETYIGPYTSIGDNVTIRGGEIENTIIIGDSVVDCGKRIVDSLIGRGTKIFSADKNLPRGYKVIVGENTFLSM